MTTTRYAKMEYETARGNEASAGAVLANPVFFMPAEEIGFHPVPSLLDRSDEIRGVDGKLTQAQNMFAPTGAATIRGYTRMLGAFLRLLFGDVTTTAGDGIITDPDAGTIPATAYRHVFKKLPGASPQTARFTLSYGPAWVRARGASATSMAFSLNDDGVKAAITLMANYLTRLTVDPADVPAYDPFSILPFRRRNVLVTLADGSTAKIDNIDFTLEQTLAYVNDLGARTGWPTDTERDNSSDGFLRASGTVTKRDMDPASWDALVNATQFALTCSMKSEQNIAATSYPYSMWFQAPTAQYVGGDGPENLKNQARHESTYDWSAGSNASGTDDFTVTIVNDVAAYK